MIDLRREEVFVFSELAKKLTDLHEFDVTRSQIHDWCIRTGRRAEYGGTVYMEWVKMPTGRASSVEAYYRFLGKLNGPPPGVEE